MRKHITAPRLLVLLLVGLALVSMCKRAEGKSTLVAATRESRAIDFVTENAGDDATLPCIQGAGRSPAPAACPKSSRF